MAEVLPLSDAELRLLKSLLDHRVRFLIVGLSAAALQGAPVVTEDIDLWFENLGDPALSVALKKVGAGYVPPFGLNPPMLAGAGSQPFDVVIRMDGLKDFPQEYARARVIRVAGLRLKILTLERVLASKEAANRPKDKLVLQVLRDSLLGSGTNKRKRPRMAKSDPRSKRTRIY